MNSRLSSGLGAASRTSEAIARRVTTAAVWLHRDARRAEPAGQQAASFAWVRTTHRLRDRWRRGQRGWPASFPVVQVPNPPLLGALVAWLVAAVSHGSVHAYARAAFYVGLAAWAWLELADGTNWARRVLGAAGLVYVVVKIGAALGG